MLIILFILELGKGNKQTPSFAFFTTMKAYCLMKLGKHSESSDLLTEIKPMN